MGKGQTISQAQNLTYPLQPKATRTSYGQGGTDSWEKLAQRQKVGGGSWSDVSYGSQFSKLQAARPTTAGTTQQTSYATQVGQGTKSDLTTAQAGSGRDQWATGDVTIPTTTQTSYEQKYGHGSIEQFTQAQQDFDDTADQWAVAPTTNPTSQQTS